MTTEDQKPEETKPKAPAKRRQPKAPAPVSDKRLGVPVTSPRGVTFFVKA